MPAVLRIEGEAQNCHPATREPRLLLVHGRKIDALSSWWWVVVVKGRGMIE